MVTHHISGNATRSHTHTQTTEGRKMKKTTGRKKKKAEGRKKKKTGGRKKKKTGVRKKKEEEKWRTQTSRRHRHHGRSLTVRSDEKYPFDSCHFPRVDFRSLPFLWSLSIYYSLGSSSSSSQRSDGVHYIHFSSLNMKCDCYLCVVYIDVVVVV